MKRQRRWMKSAIETSKTELPALPWVRRKSGNPAPAPKPLLRLSA